MEDTRLAAIRAAERIIGDPDLAEDVVQQVLVRLCRNGKATTGFTASYLVAAARNEALNAVRAQRRRRRAERCYVQSVPGTCGAYAPPDELLTRISSLLDSLPPRRRRIIEEVLYEGRGAAEIARRLGVTRRAVEKHCRCARDYFAEQLGID
jgi:RNA polymerase sigma factor (sigma-70 family)